MNCEYSDVIMLIETNNQLRDEITELKKEIELLKTKLQRNDEILKNADRPKYSKYCPNYDSDFDK